MGLFNAIKPVCIPLYATIPEGSFDIIGYVEGMYDYAPERNDKSKAVDKAKQELMKQAEDIGGDAVIHVKFQCFPGTTSSTILAYGDAIKIKKINA